MRESTRESAQVEVNRQSFDEFDAIVENDALETYKFLRDYKKRITDPSSNCSRFTYL
jgi:prephenate dehydratase